jgi:hypothetical protein
LGWQIAAGASEELAISIQPSEQKKADGGTTLFQNTGNIVPDYTVLSHKTTILTFNILHIKQ